MITRLRPRGGAAGPWGGGVGIWAISANASERTVDSFVLRMRAFARRSRHMTLFERYDY